MSDQGSLLDNERLYADKPAAGLDCGLINDPARLASLYQYDILESQNEPEFNSFTALAILLTGRPIALISMVDRERQWFISKLGFEADQTPIEQSICAYTIQSDEILEVFDAQADPRFQRNPLVAGAPGIRAYAGAPLIAPDGNRIGALCVIGQTPGLLTENQRMGLEIIAAQVIWALESRREASRFAEKWAFNRSVLASAAESIITTTIDGIITSFNPAAERLTGWSAAEMIGLRTPRDFHDVDEIRARALSLSQELGETVEPGFEVFIAHVRRGAIETREWTYVQKDGRRVPVLLTASAVRNTKGITIGFIGIARDISESRRLLNRLESANAALSEAQRIAQLGKLRDITEKKVLERTLTFIAEELTASNADSINKMLVHFIAELFSPDIAFFSANCQDSEHESETKVFIEDGEQSENIVYDRRGSPCEMVVAGKSFVVPSGLKEMFPDDQFLVEKDLDCYVGVPILDSVGKGIAIIGVMSRNARADVEQVEMILRILANAFKARMEQIEGNSRLFDLIEFSPDPILVVKSSRLINYTNQKAIGLFNCPIQVLRELSLESLFCFEGSDEPPFVRNASGDLELNALTTNTGMTLLAIPVKGRPVPVEIAVSQIVSVGEKLLILTAKDVTQRRSMEMRVRRTQRLEAIGTLTGGIAHDLNNALTPILMTTSLLRAKYPGELHIVDMLQTCVERAAGIVRQLVSFAKGAETNYSPLNVSSIAREMDRIVRDTFPKSIQLNSLIADNLPPVVGDATQLHQVLFNLCCNARDAMPLGGVLSIEVSEAEVDSAFACTIMDATEGRYVRLTVQDSGVGMSPETLEHMYEPFFTTKSFEAGTGLGLSTVLPIIRGHRGFVLCDSREGEGSRFHVYLPAALAAQAVDCPVQNEGLPHGNGETLLYVEDDSVLADAAQRVVLGLNYRVELAKDGVEAIIKYNEQRDSIRAIVTDIHMPHMDGLQLARAIRSISGDVPIIVASGRIQQSTRSELQLLHVTHFLEKPFTEARLARMLREIIGRNP